MERLLILIVPMLIPEVHSEGAREETQLGLRRENKKDNKDLVDLGGSGHECGCGALQK